MCSRVCCPQAELSSGSPLLPPRGRQSRLTSNGRNRPSLSPPTPTTTKDWALSLCTGAQWMEVQHLSSRTAALDSNVLGWQYLPTSPAPSLPGLGAELSWQLNTFHPKHIACLMYVTPAWSIGALPLQKKRRQKIFKRVPIFFVCFISPQR